VWLSSALAFQSTCSDGFRFARGRRRRCSSAVLRSQDKLSKLLVRSLDAADKLASENRARCPVKSADYEILEQDDDTTIQGMRKIRRAKRKKKVYTFIHSFRHSETCSGCFTVCLSPWVNWQLRAPHTLHVLSFDHYYRVLSFDHYYRVLSLIIVANVTL
jgi:hypothetical protein